MPASRAHSIFALAALLFAVASAQSGRFPCGTSSPEQKRCDALSHPTSRRGAGLVPVDAECVQAGSAGYFCGWAGAKCTSDTQCDFGRCSSIDGDEGVCVGGLGDPCDGPDGPDDSLCGGNLGCQPDALQGRATCGGEGADCSFFGSYQSGSKPNHGACSSGLCSPTSLTCESDLPPLAPPAAPYMDSVNGRQQPYRLSGPSRQERLSIPLGASCPEGSTVCPVARRAPQGGYLFACFDTKSSATHCGGCPSVGQGAFWDSRAEHGVDCTALPGVQSSTCAQSKCQILSCSAGYVLDDKRGSCVPKKYW
ncbi:hypothetical protein JCM8208_005212 [Rhodotorula glutinis]